MYLCIVTTKRCPLTCVTCLNASHPAGADGLPTHTLIEVLDWLAAQDQPQVELTGGEPFTRSDLPRLIEAAYERDIAVNLGTNGMLFEERHLALLAKMKRIAITFYGEESIHDQITGVPGSFRKALNTVGCLKDSAARIRANVVTMSSTLPGLPGIARELQECGAQEIKFSLMLTHGRATGQYDLLLSAAENRWLREHIDALDLHIPVIVQGFADNRSPCHIPSQDNLCLDADGRLYACVFFSGKKPAALGRVTAHEPAWRALESVAWDKALRLYNQAAANACPAWAESRACIPHGVRLSQGCPPFLERIVDGQNT